MFISCCTNRLQNVVDAMNNQQTILGDFRISQTYMAALGNPSVKSSTAYDYTYDNNGNLTVDQNKDIGTLNNSTGALVTQGIVYNYLNLPQTVNFNNKGTITYTYDAAGNKLKKQTVEPSGSISYLGTAYTTSITTTTTYLNGMVYQSLSYGNTSLPAGLLTQQYTDKLQFAAHEEGRIRALYTNVSSPTTITGYAFDYLIKDHLGNTRILLTDEQATDPPYVATMEQGNATAEQQVFANISSTRVGKPTAFDGNTGNASVALTNSTGNKIGPSLLLKVMAGDNLSISVSAYYNAASGTSYNAVTLVATDLLTNLLSTSTGIPVTGSAHATLADLQANSGVINSSTQSFLSTRTAPNANVPKAYLNYIFLDDQFMYAGGYAAPVTSACATSAQPLRSNPATVAVPKNGYVYVYVSNESNYNVYFDNLQVVYQHGPILEDNAYYPFGLTMAGISDKAVKTNYSENKFKFNGGNELQNKEFSDGSGLETYDAVHRMYDPQIGRFGQIDKFAAMSESMSSYIFASNNPSLRNDPFGLKDSIPVLKPFIFVGHEKGGSSSARLRPFATLQVRMVTDHTGVSPHIDSSILMPSPSTLLGNLSILEKSKEIFDNGEKVADAAKAIARIIKLLLEKGRIDAKLLETLEGYAEEGGEIAAAAEGAIILYQGLTHEITPQECANSFAKLLFVSGIGYLGDAIGGPVLGIVLSYAAEKFLEEMDKLDKKSFQFIQESSTPPGYENVNVGNAFHP